MRRRDVLKSGATSLAATLARTIYADASERVPIIDAHIHLFDPSRPQGVPWPEKSDAVLYKPALPERYKTVTKGLGIRGAIAIECSPWESDNDWLLETASKDPVIVGVIGDLVPGSPSFHTTLDRLSRNPIFRGIRYGNLWDRNLSVDMSRQGFIEDLKVLSDARLVLESANPDAELISALVRVHDKVPELTIVVDHLPNAKVPTEVPAQREYMMDLKRLRDRPGVYVKLSEIPVRVNQEVPLQLSFYKEKLDILWDIFGEDRLLFGSDWPNSDHLVSYEDTFGLIRRYIGTKSRAAEKKFFGHNSVAAYHWHPRLPTQEGI